MLGVGGGTNHGDGHQWSGEEDGKSHSRGYGHGGKEECDDAEDVEGSAYPGEEEGARRELLLHLAPEALGIEAEDNGLDDHEGGQKPETKIGCGHV